jgi:hypothetical protein
MSPVDVIRAWKDDAYRNSLSQEDMLSVSGGCTTCGNPLHTPVRSCKPSPFEEIAL